MEGIKKCLKTKRKEDRKILKEEKGKLKEMIEKKKEEKREKKWKEV